MIHKEMEIANLLYEDESGFRQPVLMNTFYNITGAIYSPSPFFASEFLEIEIKEKLLYLKNEELLNHEAIWLGTYQYQAIKDSIFTIPYELCCIHINSSWHLFSMSYIPKGSLIGCFAGIIERKPWWNPSYRFFCNSFRYTLGTTLNQYIINASRYCNHTRLIQHSTKSNVSSKGLYIDEMYYVILIAHTNINIGEELVLNYHVM